MSIVKQWNWNLEDCLVSWSDMHFCKRNSICGFNPIMFFIYCVYMGRSLKGPIAMCRVCLKYSRKTKPRRDKSIKCSYLNRLLSGFYCLFLQAMKCFTNILQTEHAYFVQQLHANAIHFIDSKYTKYSYIVRVFFFLN